MTHAITSSRTLRLTLIVSGALLLGAGNCGGGGGQRQLHAPAGDNYISPSG